MWLEKILDVPKLFRRLMVILWITLLLFVVAKLCFNLWYPLVVENEKVLEICSFIDKVPILRMTILCLLYTFSFSIVYLTSTKRIKFNNRVEKWLIILTGISISLIKEVTQIGGFIIELSFMVLIPIFINIKRKIYKNNLINIALPIVVCIAINLWQSTMMFIRGLEEVISTLPFIITLVIQIDYYIFIVITMIGVYMGSSGFGWWWGKSETQLLAIKEEELKKPQPSEKILKEIEEALAKLKAKKEK